MFQLTGATVEPHYYRRLHVVFNAGATDDDTHIQYLGALKLRILILK